MEENGYDVLGIGFGPANLSLAIAIREDSSPVRPHFVEARTDPKWQGGMLLDGSNIQNHPSRDLVTLRNPQSRYSFLNYLFENDRLVEHLNLPMEFPLRKEYADYISWATRQFDDCVTFGAMVTDIKFDRHRSTPVYVAVTSDGAEYVARSLVLATGRTPYVPSLFDGLSTKMIFHLTDYLYRIEELDSPPNQIAVVGGSQSGVEIVLDLARRYPGARVSQYVRAHSLRLKDTSPFSEEGYFPEFTDYYYRASRSGKRILDAYMRPTNYSSSDADVLHQLYNLIYEQRIDRAQRLFVEGDSEISAVAEVEDGVRLRIRDLQSGATRDDEVDIVVLATGFRDLGPEDHQEPYPPLLAEIADSFRFDSDGYLEINDDYSLRAVRPQTPPIFLNGLCESTHGIGDAGSFSLLSLRAKRIRDGLLKSAVDLARMGDE
ncbi:lysine N(6)-hydroxylase/L-ornithine N(5)-oxygenase family protein [Nocardia anaemiae]|uniref:lysine N(6)-hydroxylase/L-ornithine N(5)-oxygenase family protein n=1 Tax=Nocardia anaemiae TaxID=263910 RepID=UPI0007A5662E|nr:SidA/IucD/PvdA family monooxygenase [Nocardia anaemiae]